MEPVSPYSSVAPTSGPLHRWARPVHCPPSLPCLNTPLPSLHCALCSLRVGARLRVFSVPERASARLASPATINAVRLLTFGTVLASLFVLIVPFSS